MDTVKRYDNLVFGVKPKLINYDFSQKNVFIAKVVDDSSFTPDSEVVRGFIKSGSSVSQGVYDFDNGIDNGFNPVSRDLSLDFAEVNNAVNKTVEDAKSKISSEKDEKKKSERLAKEERIIDALADMADSQSDSSAPAEQ